MFARYYGSGISRFLSVDPVTSVLSRSASPQSLNLYSYVGNNPVAYVDPNGEEPVIFVDNQTTITRSQFSASNVVSNVQSQFDDSGVAATVKEGTPGAMDRISAFIRGDEIMTVSLQDNMAADSSDDHMGMVTGKDTEMVAVAEHILDNPDTPGNHERETSVANTVSHEVGHLSGLGHNKAKPTDVMTAPVNANEDGKTLKKFNKKDVKELQEKK